jgi:Tol biopolymer transport system component
MTPAPERIAAALAGHYRFERELGRGGMATVWLAEDVRHHRRVAIKVLHPELSAVLGPERFLKEIELTAGLQHPHILPLFDSGEADGRLWYVMPYVEGETLRARLARERQLPVADAVRIAREVAEALDYAHRRGVIHRDVKPENILLHEGRALVADFGIALAVRNAGGARVTETGLSLGTPQYMSPEQATAERELDARSDVYSLGCVLYEMLAGEPPHTGPTTQAIIAKIITDKPRPLTELREAVPAPLAVAVHTALAKLPADRFSSAAELAAALARPETATAVQGAGLARSPRRSRGLALAAAAVVTVGLVALGWFLGRRGGDISGERAPPSRLAIVVPGLGGSGGTALQRQIALTPDGSAVLFIAATPDGSDHLMRQSLDADQAKPVPGVPVDPASPTISPDGRWVVLASYGHPLVQRFPIEGGSGSVLPIEERLDAVSFLDWDRDGAIWYSTTTGLRRLAPGADSSTVPFGASSVGLQMQQILPDGRHALMVRRPVGTASGPPLVFDLRTAEETPLLTTPVVQARYTAGHLVLAMPGGTLQAAPFDADERRLAGDALVTVATGVSVSGNGIAQLTVARNGTVAYIPEELRSLVLVDRAGGIRPALDARHLYHAPAFSPDGRRLAVDYAGPEGRDVWVLTLEQGTFSRATFERDGHDAVWTPDGRFLTYTSTRSGTLGVYRTRPGSAEPAESLLASRALLYTGRWLRDGSALVTVAVDLRPGSGNDIALVRNGGRGPVEPLAASRFTEAFPTLSPDERWLAFVSDQSGRQEVYVRPLGAEGEQVQVSLAGGSEPLWGPDGRELFYRSHGEGRPELIAATVRATPQFAVTARRPLLPLADIDGSNPHTGYDISPDGRTFAMVRRSPATRIVVIQNLPELVRRLRGAPFAPANP